MGSHYRARRGLRALVVSTLVSVALIATSAPNGGAATPAATTTNIQRARQGAQWLANQIKHNGGVIVNFGNVDAVQTAYAVIGMRAAGVDKPASNLATSYLEKHIGAEIQLGGKDSAGALAQYILAAVADSQDPRHFGGTAPKNNLVGRLLATARASGSDKGLFGTQDPSFDGAFRQGLALAALKEVHVADPRVTAAVAWMTKQQCSNGLWQPYRAHPAIPCGRANPTTFTGPDTNSTAFAVQGLAAWGKFPRQRLLLKSLKAAQSSDAGFPFMAAAGQASDPNSTALVIQALVAENSAPSVPMWKQGANSPYTALASFQLSCTSSDFGAFFFSGSASANLFATVQSVPAMAGKKLPIPSSAASAILPLPPC